MGEAVTDKRLTTTILDALPEEMYFKVKMQSIRDPNSGLEEIICTMKTIFMSHSERLLVLKRNSGRDTITDNVRESAMTLTYHNCKKPGHEKENRKELMENLDKPSNVENGTRKWCLYHHSNGHSNGNYYQQQQSGKSSARITRAEITQMTSTITREMVVVTIPLTVKVQKMRRSLRTVM